MSEKVKRTIQEWLDLADKHLAAAEKALPENPALAKAEIDGARRKIRKAQQTTAATTPN
jgi:hypothetical protein